MSRATTGGGYAARVRRRCGLALALACALLWVRAAAALSITDEKDLGRTFELEARAKLPLIDDVEVTGYVSRIGQKIVHALGEQPFTYHFFVVRNASVNAFAVPGGYIYVNGGLLIEASNDDEVAGVLGHEIAHVNAHHLARQQEATKLLNYTALLGALLSVVQPAIGAGAAAASAAVELKYRREFEQEADYLGATYMRQAGYDPRGMLDFFKKLLDEQRLNPAGAPPYLLSHPLTQVRLTNLEAVLHTHQWDRGARAPITLALQRVQLLVRARLQPAQDLLSHYRDAVEAQPTDGRARYLLGLAYLESGVYDTARQSFDQARELGFKDVDRELGRALLHLGQLDKARTLLSRAAEIHPDDPVAHHELARVLEAQGDTTGAMREYERTLQLAPTCEEAQYALGILQGRAGREGDGFYHLGKAFILRGELTKALSQFRKAQPLLPAGSAQAQEVRVEIADLSDFLRHGRVHTH